MREISAAELDVMITHLGSDVLKAELDAGLDPNTLVHNFTLLVHAMLRQRTDIYELLKNAKADLQKPVLIQGRSLTPLHFAVNWQNDKAFFFLLKNGVDPKPLFFDIACRGTTKMHQALLDQVNDEDIIQIFRTGKEEILKTSIPTLGFDFIKRLLKNADILNFLPENTFLNLLTISNDLADFVLQNPNCLQKLNSINKKGNQLFACSCAANAIMNSLFDKSEWSNAKEFEIFRKIWSAPGKEADPQKLVDYLVQQGFQLQCLDFTDISAKLLTKVSQKFTMYKSAMEKYTFFKSAALDRYQAVSDHHEAHRFIKGATLLLVQTSNAIDDKPTADGSLNTHFVFGQIQDDGKFVVQDPDGKKRLTFQSLDDYFENEMKFTGILFNATR